MSFAKRSKEDLVMFDANKLLLNINEEEQLVLKIEGEEEYIDINVNPAFPLSEVGRFLFFVDNGGNEIGMLKDIQELKGESRNVLEAILDRIYFMPKIVQINNIVEEFGVSRWDVVTEKGPRVFDIRSRRRDVRPFGRNRIIIHDIDGNRYEIPDYTKLDKNSQKVLDSEI